MLARCARHAAARRLATASAACAVPSRHASASASAGLSRPDSAVTPAGAPVAAGVAAAYTALVGAGRVTFDSAQWAAAQRLDVLRDGLSAHAAALEQYRAALAAREALRRRRLAELEAAEAARPPSPAGAGLARWVSSALRSATGRQPTPPESESVAAAARRARQVEAGLPPAPARPPAPRGVYLYGGVGAGKSMLMDLFYASTSHLAPTGGGGEGATLGRRRRLHFNALMVEMNGRMHARFVDRHEGEGEGETPGRAGVVRDGRARAALVATRRRARAAARARFGGTSNPDSTGAENGAAAAVGPGRPPRGADPGGGVWGASSAAVMAVAAELLAEEEPHEATTEATHEATHEVTHEATEVSAHETHETPEAIPRASLLCLDEMQAGDPFTAVCLGGALEALAASGCVLVATSNRAPGELHADGTQAALFARYAASLAAAAEPWRLAAAADYRTLWEDQPSREGEPSREDEASREGRAARGGYFSPLGPAASAAFEASWADATGGIEDDPPGTLAVPFGRTLLVPRGRRAARVARFRFSELCARFLGPADYLALAGACGTVFVEGIPLLSLNERDQARRFISLIDELYNARCCLVATAAGPPGQLFRGRPGEEPIVVDLEGLQFEGAAESGGLRRDVAAPGGVAPLASAAARAALGGQEEAFAFARAVSRLREMQSPGYVGRARGIP